MSDFTSPPIAETNGHTREGPDKENHEVIHKPTIEEVPDEEDIIKRHDTPVSNSVLEAVDDAGSPEPRQPVRERYTKPVNKDAAQAPKTENKPKAAPVDLSSKELFPELTASKQAPLAVPSWGAGKVSAGNSAAASGAATPTSSTSSPHAGPGSFSIPGQHQYTLALTQSELLPRSQLKRPIPDILKDISRKLNVKINLTTGVEGRLFFLVVGPTDAVVRAACKDLASKICTVVCYINPSVLVCMLTILPAKNQCRDSSFREGTDHWQGRSHDQGHPGEDWSTYHYAKERLFIERCGR